jgi:hypothetical protein
MVALPLIFESKALQYRTRCKCKWAYCLPLLYLSGSVLEAMYRYVGYRTTSRLS